MARDSLSLLFLWFLILFQETRAVPVKIGAIINPTTRIGREQRVAIQLAVEKFSDLTLLADVSDLNTTDPSPVYSYVQDLDQLGASTIIAGGTVPQAFISGAVGEGRRIPVVSLAPSPFLSGKFLIQMSYPETALVRCLADIIKSYNWRKVIAVYEDDAFGSVSSSALLLSNALRAIGSEIEYRAIFPPADSISDPRKTVREELNHMKSQLSTVYIILHMSEAIASVIFEEAVSQGIMSKGYIWICANDIATLLDSSFTPSFISKYMQGLVGIKSYINETAPGYVNFHSNFQQRFKTHYQKSGESSYDPGVYAVRTYDVVDAIALAAATSEKNKRTIIENLMASNFSGFSGLIRPTNGSLDESERYSGFRIINVAGRSYREMAIWVDGKGFYDNEDGYILRHPSSEKLKSVVFWPGGPLTTPSGLRRLKVGVPATDSIWNNFVLVKNVDGKAAVSGFCIDVFTATLSCLGYEVMYDFVPYDINDYDELVNKVYSKDIDIVVADVTILANRSENVSFTKPYLTSGLALLVPLKIDRSGWVPTETFSWELWLCILGIFVYFTLLVWYHEVISEQGMESFRVQLLKKLGSSFWIVCNAIFLNLDKRISKYQTKIVVILWFFVAQLVLNSFTASLSSILITQKLKPDVKATKIGCDGYSFVPNYLTSVLNYPPESIVKIYSQNEFKKAFENGTITAAYLEVPYLRVFLSQNDNYTVHGETQMLGGFGFALPIGSLLASDMSEAILKIGENGTLRYLEKKWFPVSLSNYAAPDDNSKQSLGLSNYTYVFVITSILALLTFLHKCFCARRSRGQQEASGEPAAHEGEANGDPAAHDDMAQGQANGEPGAHDGVEMHEGQPNGEPAVRDVIQENEQPAVHNGEQMRVLQHAFSFPTLSLVGRVLRTFNSFRPRRVQDIEVQPLRYGIAHEAEEPPLHDGGNNILDPHIRNEGVQMRVLQHAPSFPNRSMVTRVFRPFNSLGPRRIQDIEVQPLHYNIAHGADEAPLHEGTNEIQERNGAQRNDERTWTRLRRAMSASYIWMSSVPQNNNAELGLGGTMRHRRLNTANNPGF